MEIRETIEGSLAGLDISYKCVQGLLDKKYEPIEVKSSYGNLDILEIYVLDGEIENDHCYKDDIPHIVGFKVKLHDFDSIRIASTKLICELVAQMEVSSVSGFVDSFKKNRFGYMKFLPEQLICEIYERDLTERQQIQAIAEKEGVKYIYDTRDLRDAVNSIKWSNLIF